jgi:hypothetical protein
LVEQHGMSPARWLYYFDQWQVIEERESGTTSDPVQAQYVLSPVYVDSMILRDRNADGNPSNGFQSRYQTKTPGTFFCYKTVSCS